MPVQPHPTHRKTRWSTQPPRPSAGTHAQPYRRRRPETTTLHRIVREHLETYLALANESDPMGDGVPDHVEKEFRSYLKCGILAHGFARARCSGCGYEFLVAFSCKARGACFSCGAKRMAATAAHLVDHVIPHVPVRQWVLSVPKRLRPFLHHRPRTASAVLHILLRALRATLREACPTAPADASFGAVGFLHRFGSSLNPHFHYHLIVLDGLFEKIEADTSQDPATNPGARLRFHEATALTHEFSADLQHTVRSRVLRHFRHHGLLEPHDAQDMLAWDHGVFAPNAPLRPLVTARAQEDHALAPQVSGLDGLPTAAAPEVPSPQPERANRKAPDTPPSRPSRWAALLARIYEVFPLICPSCRTPLTFIAFLTDPEPITKILVHIGEPTSPPLLHPARGPPQTELAMGPDGGQAEEVDQHFFPDDLDQSSDFDPADPEPIPKDDFDRSWEA